jgi:probable H4MPT-linked C1 transfer pathway protein
MARPTLGLDIGGANLKAAHTSGAARSVPFALWKDPGGLDAAVGRLAASMPRFDALAVTMTGELCDCFASKREGVGVILNAVEGLARRVRVWTNEGRFVDPAEGRQEALKVASANWLALATFAGRFAPRGEALLIDMGTTTTDVIPLIDGRPIPQARTDPERLGSCELVYRGWKRTPLCAVLDERHASEFFATMYDVFIVLGKIPENVADRDTADGLPATAEHAERRLARMLCADLETSTPGLRRQLAEEAYEALLGAVEHAVADVALRMPRVPGTAILAGSGAFMLPEAVRSSLTPLRPITTVALNDELGDDVSAAACAYAVAVLASEREG